MPKINFMDVKKFGEDLDMYISMLAGCLQMFIDKTQIFATRAKKTR
jgi:hypothetical protein